MYSIYTIHAYLNKLCFVASKNMQMTFDTDKKEIDWKEVPDWGSYSVPTYEQFQQFVIDHIVTSQPDVTRDVDEFYMNIERERGNIH